MNNDNIFCQECGAKLEDGSIFCQECGASIETNLSNENDNCDNLNPKPEEITVAETSNNSVENIRKNSTDATINNETNVTATHKDLGSLSKPNSGDNIHKKSHNTVLGIAIIFVITIAIVFVLLIKFDIINVNVKNLGKTSESTLTTEMTSETTEITTMYTTEPTTFETTKAPTTEPKTTVNYNELEEPAVYFPSYYSAEVTCENTGLNMRYGPGKEYSVIIVIPNHSYVLVCGANNSFDGWAYVCFNDVFGWINRDYLYEYMDY